MRDMAFSEFELAQIDKTVGRLCRQRTRPELRSKLSLEYQIKGHDVTLIERRPHWDGSPGFTEHGMELTRFRGHPRRGVYGCHGEAEASGVHARVQG